MNLNRHLDTPILNHFQKYREVLVLIGARQVGKTTLLSRLFPEAYFFSCDNNSVREGFERYDISSYKQFIPKSAKIIVIDEAQLLSDAGRAAKIIYDQLPEYRLIVTGSSALNIRHKTVESLAGRKIDYFLYPLTFSEYLVQKGIERELSFRSFFQIVSGSTGRKEHVHAFDIKNILRTCLLFGTYPAILEHPSDQTYLNNLIDSAVLKDILDLRLIEERSVGLKVLQLLAYQIGSLVNMTEIANRLSIDVKTVRRYIDLFTQSYIIFPLYPYSRVGRDEFGKMPKIYFWDTGVRNALIGNFQPIEVRGDAGMLFENFVISEFKKINDYGKTGYSFHFWRTRQGSEIDLVLEKLDELFGIECKFSGGNPNRAFISRYSRAKLATITTENFY